MARVGGQWGCEAHGVPGRSAARGIRDLNAREGLTVLLVEQNANQALRLAHRGYVLVNGRIAMEGTGAGLLARPEVREAYLGG